MVNWRRSVRGIALVDVLIAAGLTAGAVVTVLGRGWSTGTAPALVASCVSAALIALRRRATVVMAAGFAAGLLALAAIRPPGGTPLWAFVALLIAAFSAAAQLPQRHAGYATAGLAAAGVVFHARLDSSNPVEAVVSPLVIVGLPAAAGALLRRSRAQAARLAALTAELAEQRDQVRAAAVQAERARIARELHDVIAHTVGVMVVQAGAAERLLASGHQARGPVHAIRVTGKEAMSELRRVVGLLRAVGHEPADPQPGMADLHELVDAARAAGPVEAHLGSNLELPSGAALTVYRTVQEALTNARRHAPGAPVQVSLRAQDGQMCVTVENERPHHIPEPGPAGFGLIGLAERAELYGGTCRTGPRPDGGWRVSLRLPLADNPVTDTASTA